MPTYEVFTAKKPIVKLEDFKGLKIRTSGAAMSNVIKALGAVPVQIPTPDISIAMQRGTVDGTTFAYLSAKAYKVKSKSSTPRWARISPRRVPAYGYPRDDLAEAAGRRARGNDQGERGDRRLRHEVCRTKKR